MLIKVIFLLRLTLSPHEKKARKIKAIPKSSGLRKEKIFRRQKKSPQNDIFRNQLSGLKKIFETLTHILNFIGTSPFNTLGLFASVLLFLRKLSHIVIFVFFKILDSLLDEDNNGN